MHMQEVKDYNESMTNHPRTPARPGYMFSIGPPSYTYFYFEPQIFLFNSSQNNSFIIYSFNSNLTPNNYKEIKLVSKRKLVEAIIPVPVSDQPGRMHMLWYSLSRINAKLVVPRNHHPNKYGQKFLHHMKGQRNHTLLFYI